MHKAIRCVAIFYLQQWKCKQCREKNKQRQHKHQYQQEHPKCIYVYTDIGMRSSWATEQTFSLVPVGFSSHKTLFRWINKDSADFGKQVACFFYAQVFLFFEMSPVLIVQCTVQVFFTNIDCILSIKIFDFAHTKHSSNNLQFDCSASIFICKRLQSRQ